MSKRIIEITNPHTLAWFAKHDSKRTSKPKKKYSVKTAIERDKIKKIRGQITDLQQAFDARTDDIGVYRNRYRGLWEGLQKLLKSEKRKS